MHEHAQQGIDKLQHIERGSRLTTSDGDHVVHTAAAQLPDERRQRLRPFKGAMVGRRPSAAPGKAASSDCRRAWLAGERAGAMTVAPASRKARTIPEPTMPALL